MSHALVQIAQARAKGGKDEGAAALVSRIRSDAKRAGKKLADMTPALSELLQQLAAKKPPKLVQEQQATADMVEEAKRLHTQSVVTLEAMERRVLLQTASKRFNTLRTSARTNFVHAAIGQALVEHGGAAQLQAVMDAELALFGQIVRLWRAPLVQKQLITVAQASANCGKHDNPDLVAQCKDYFASLKASLEKSRGSKEAVAAARVVLQNAIDACPAEWWGLPDTGSVVKQPDVNVTVPTLESGTLPLPRMFLGCMNAVFRATPTGMGGDFISMVELLRVGGWVPTVQPPSFLPISLQLLGGNIAPRLPAAAANDVHTLLLHVLGPLSQPWSVAPLTTLTSDEVEDMLRPISADESPVQTPLASALAFTLPVSTELAFQFINQARSSSSAKTRKTAVGLAKWLRAAQSANGRISMLEVLGMIGIKALKKTPLVRSFPWAKDLPPSLATIHAATINATFPTTSNALFATVQQGWFTKKAMSYGIDNLRDANISTFQTTLERTLGVITTLMVFEMDAVQVAQNFVDMMLLMGTGEAVRDVIVKVQRAAIVRQEKAVRQCWGVVDAFLAKWNGGVTLMEWRQLEKHAKAKSPEMIAANPFTKDSLKLLLPGPPLDVAHAEMADRLQMMAMLLKLLAKTTDGREMMAIKKEWTALFSAAAIKTPEWMTAFVARRTPKRGPSEKISRDATLTILTRAPPAAAGEAVAAP